MGKDLGKVYEKMLRKRLRTVVDEAGGLADSQDGFRVQRSTIGAIREVTRRPMRRGRATTGLGMLASWLPWMFRTSLTRPISKWADILEALEQRFTVPPYLLRVIDD